MTVDRVLHGSLLLPVQGKEVCVGSEYFGQLPLTFRPLDPKFRSNFGVGRFQLSVDRLPKDKSSPIL